MDMQQPPETPVIEMPAGNLTFTTESLAKFPAPVEVLRITPDGKIERRGMPIEQLSKDDLLVVVRELVELIRTR